MFQTKDGKKKFGSGFAAKHYDENHSEDGMHKMGEGNKAEDLQVEPEENTQEKRRDETAEGESKQRDESPDETDKGNEEHPVVAEHGHAHKVIIHHDEKAGRHHVTSHHKDGHENHSDHEDMASAHEEGKKLAGVPADGQAKESDSPFHQGKGQASASSEEDGFAMPDLV